MYYRCTCITFSSGIKRDKQEAVDPAQNVRCFYYPLTLSKVYSLQAVCLLGNNLSDL